MTRINTKTRLANATALLSVQSMGALAELLEGILETTAAEDIEEIDTSTRAGRRRAKAAAAEKTAAKPAVGRGRRAAKDEDEEVDAKPVRRKRRVAKTEDDATPVRRRRAAAVEEDETPEPKVRRTRKPKVEAFEGEVTIDDLADFLDNVEVEPVEGTLADLKKAFIAIGGDIDVFYEDIAEAAEIETLTASDKKEALGEFLASIDALKAKIVATLKMDEAAFDDVIDEYELELRDNARGSTIAAAIIGALMEELFSEEDGDEDAAEDEEEEVVEPVKRRTARASGKVAGRKAAVEEDEDDEEPVRKPRRGSLRASAKDEAPKKRSSKNDLEELDELDD